jgi:hypothetical protein
LPWGALLWVQHRFCWSFSQRTTRLKFQRRG